MCRICRQSLSSRCIPCISGTFDDYGIECKKIKMKNCKHEFHRHCWTVYENVKGSQNDKCIICDE